VRQSEASHVIGRRHCGGTRSACFCRLIKGRFRPARICLLVVAALTSASLAAAEVQHQVVTVQARKVGASTVLGGTVLPFKEVTLTAQVPGRVVFIAGEEGDWFKSGEILISLDKDELLATRAQALAQLRNAEAAWRASRAEVWRQYYAGNEPMPGMESAQNFDWFTRPFSSMFGGERRYGQTGVHRGTDIYTARARADQAWAGMQAVKAQIEQIDSKLRDSDSVAPFTGVITQKLVEVGDTVQPGQPLLKIAYIQQLQVHVEVPARLVVGLKIGMSIPVKLDVGDVIVKATVAQIYPMADPQRHTVTVKLDLPKDAPGAPGMYAEVMVPDTTTPAEELPVVPYSALVWRGSLPALFVVGSDDRPELRMVRVGEQLDNSVTILSGLKPGERVITDPTPGMASGWTPKSAAAEAGGGPSPSSQPQK
jgi:multidrug efflux pump subunit AcrA (membrane-fusion protein)